jgi:hypothetical protein
MAVDPEEDMAAVPSTEEDVEALSRLHPPVSGWSRLRLLPRALLVSLAL